jgi:dolichyl-phosphate beta-glucosyltransferase
MVSQPAPGIAALRPISCRSAPQPPMRVVSPWTHGVLPPRAPADLEVVIPAFNEAERLPETLRRTVEFLRCQEWSSRVLVVDNGSCDGTADVVATHVSATDDVVPVALIGCSRPGKGAAVRRGLLSSRSRYVGFFDADLATPLETLRVAMAELEAGATVVIGSRYVVHADLVQLQPLVRRMGGATFRLLATRAVRNVHDTQCGFKFFERRALTRALAQCRVTGFAFDVELLRQLQRDGEHIVEVPVAWTDGRQSTFHSLRDGPPAFYCVLQMQPWARSG